jgi:hypothetical protein
LTGAENLEEDSLVNIRYNPDAHTGLPHIYGHNVHESEVEDVLRRPLENMPGSANSRIVIGRTRAGRILKVIIVPDDDGDGVFVVTAFDLIGKPLRAFRRRSRNRGES